LNETEDSHGKKGNGKGNRLKKVCQNLEKKQYGGAD